jgi:hypothetical protein
MSIQRDISHAGSEALGARACLVRGVYDAPESFTPSHFEAPFSGVMGVRFGSETGVTQGADFKTV